MGVSKGTAYSPPLGLGSLGPPLTKDPSSDATARAVAHIQRVNDAASTGTRLSNAQMAPIIKAYAQDLDDAYAADKAARNEELVNIETQMRRLVEAVIALTKNR